MATVIVTGSGTGLGRALSRKLVARGDKVVAMGRRLAPLTALADELGDNLLPCSVDLADASQVATAFDHAQEWGGVPDIVIHSAGVGQFGPVESYSPDQIQTVLNCNLVSTLMVAQQVKQRWGDQPLVLVNVLSTAAQTGKANESLYCASKWGMKGLLESLRAEWKGSAIQLVNCYPSGIRSEFWEGSDHVDASGFMDPAECADALLSALTSRASCYVGDLNITRR